MPACTKIDFNKIYESKYGPYKIIANAPSYNRHTYVKIQFLNTGYTTEVRKEQALKGLVKDDLYGIDFNKTYNSRYGPYNIIEYLGRDKTSTQFVKIKFQISGGEAISRLYFAQNGQVQDLLYGLDFNHIYTSNNYGQFKIISIDKNEENYGHPRAFIQFLNTGNIKSALISSIIRGAVRDDGGKVDYKNYGNIDIDKILKSVWEGMINRCDISGSSSYKSYGQVGVSIDPLWYDLNTFINDAKTLPQFDKFMNAPNMYRLDKDYLQLNIPKSQRIYSKQTCMFLSIMDNSNLRVIENKRDFPERYSSKYYNVSKRGSGYTVTMNINGNPMYFGTYYDEVVAAAVANFWQEKYHLYDIIPLLNDVPYIDPANFINYRVNPKLLYKLVDK